MLKLGKQGANAISIMGTSVIFYKGAAQLFEVMGTKGMGILWNVPQSAEDGLLEFSAAVNESAPKADSPLISCGALKTLNIIVPLEKRCKVPSGFQPATWIAERRPSARPEWPRGRFRLSNC